MYHLVHDIPEDDFNVNEGGQVEIIGWMYQYYNTEPKMKLLRKRKDCKRGNSCGDTAFHTRLDRTLYGRE